MGAIATFDYSYWQATYFEFDYLGQAQVQAYFDLAGQSSILDNTGLGPVCSTNEQKVLMHLLTAHVVKLFGPGPTDAAGNTQGPQEVVGRISSAGEGSVNIQTENNYPPGDVQWFQQTKYGSMFWLATAKYRSARWIGRPFRRPSMGPPWIYGTSSNWP